MESQGPVPIESGPVDADAEIARLSGEVARAHAEKDKFVYICSHDLREPVRMITGFLSLLQRKLPALDDRQKEYFGFVMSGAQRIDELLNDLLTFSRCGTGRKPAPMQVAEAVQEAVIRTGEAISRTKAVVEISPGLPELVADRAQLTTLFQQLIDNPVKFRSKAPSVVPLVRISAKRQDREWVFTVADNGIGIVDTDGARVFDIFQRLHAREDYPGNGVGLALCKKIVEQHGGRIAIAGQLNAGATVTFTLPA